MTVTDVKQSRVRLWANTFNVNVRAHKEEQFEHERYYLAATTLADELTEYPTVPNRLLKIHTPQDLAQTGMGLGTSRCAVKGCNWE